MGEIIYLAHTLSRVFSYPAEKVFGYGKGENLVSGFAGDMTLCSDEEKAAFRDAADTYCRDSGRMLDQVQVEYTRLFINAYPSIVVSPYECSYRSSTYGEQTAVLSNLNRLYFKGGYVLADCTGERPDHIAVELLFLSLMAEGAQKGIKNKMSCLKEIIEAHCIKWLRNFFILVKETSTEPLYRMGSTLGLRLEKFLESHGSHITSTDDIEGVIVCTR